MRLLIDEDLASRELVTRLERVLPGGILPPERAMSDDSVWARAQGAGAAILTGNVVDFLHLAAENPDHFGLLIVYRLNDPTKDLRAHEIAARVEAIAARYPNGIRSLVLAVNNFPLSQPGAQ